MAGKMIAVGDNVVDCYLDDHVYYPGGNAVNVAVNCRRDGIEDVAYIGMFGNDGKAEHLKWALTQENVHFERSRTMYAPSGSPGVRLIDGDRKFVGGPRNTAQHVARIRLTPEDLDYIEQYGLCHTSCFSRVRAAGDGQALSGFLRFLRAHRPGLSGARLPVCDVCVLLRLAHDAGGDRGTDGSLPRARHEGRGRDARLQRLDLLGGRKALPSGHRARRGHRLPPGRH